MRSRSDDTCQLGMYTFQSFHTPNILDLLLIVPQIWTWPPKLNLVHWSMKWSWGQVKTVWQAWGPCKLHTYHYSEIPREKLTLQKNLYLFFKWSLNNENVVKDNEQVTEGNFWTWSIYIESMKYQGLPLSKI